MGLIFEWDDDKAKQNVTRHGITFQEAATVFGDPLSFTIEDPLHSTEEDRFIIIGQSARQRLLVIVHTERDNRIRIISARVATRHERESYEESNSR